MIIKKYETDEITAARYKKDEDIPVAGIFCVYVKAINCNAPKAMNIIETKTHKLEISDTIFLYFSGKDEITISTVK
ncbi:hypothetical protein BKG90_11580 [Rodentibacter caecimuris]|uniref:Uncharacterized protein n=1 Tax=Rodentibacter caecimuris TaxID=1796644 RepID=A0AAJ3N028_9PAST|nr:hypothetical protein BKG90_11580 [Rodentibacter heylii]